jgi:hypothetical protein
MAVYDDKTSGIIKSGNYSMIGSVQSRTEAVFKASYIVASSIQVKGKITALFDLIVIGDVVAHDIDVKGRFVCFGNCEVENSIIVQDKLFVNGIRAKYIEAHDDITAQEIDVDVLKADGNVIVGQTLATEELAQSEQKILCGDTAYGAGRISAYAIITGEELDMDDGVEAVIDPNEISFDQGEENKKVINGKKYAEKNDFVSYLEELFDNCDTDDIKQYTFVRWMRTLKKVSETKKQPNFECYDIGLLLGLTEMYFSEHFNGWDIIAEWHRDFLDKFSKLANGESVSLENQLTLKNLYVGQRLLHKTNGAGKIVNLEKKEKTIATVLFDDGTKLSYQMEIALKFFAREDAPTPDEIISKLYINPEEFEEWANYIQILEVYGHVLSPKIVDLAMDLLCAKIGVKSKFILDRIKENGWTDDGK